MPTTARRASSTVPHLAPLPKAEPERTVRDPFAVLLDRADQGRPGPGDPVDRVRLRDLAGAQARRRHAGSAGPESRRTLGSAPATRRRDQGGLQRGHDASWGGPMGIYLG